MKKIPQLSDPSNDEVPADRPPDAPGGSDGVGGAATGPRGHARAEFPDSDRVSGARERDDDAVTAPATRTPPASREGGGSSGSRGAKKLARGPARRFARERALQALYQWDMADSESSAVRRQFIEHQDMSRVDVEYFERLFRGISHDVEKVDASLATALDRPLVEVDPIERAVLRIAAFELVEVLETPARVIINEGVEITKRFGADNGHRYVNGVLDGLAATLRPLEMRRG